MYPKSSLQLNIETEETIMFFTAPFLPFDNFSAHQVEIWGRLFPTAEHAFQWKKFESSCPLVAEKIYAAKSPWAVKQVSSQSKGRRSDWGTIKLSVMEDILRAKVIQHVDVGDMLLGTVGKTIIENSPVDSYWGCGPNGTGENRLGKILMKIRDDEVKDES